MALSLKAFLGLDGSGFELGMKRAESSVNKFGHSLDSLAKDKIAELFGVAALEEGIRRTIEFGHRMANVSKQMGITTDEAQQLDYQMSETNGSIEAAATAFKKLKLAQAEVLKGSHEFRGYFARLGISPEDAANSTAAQLYKRIGGRLGGMEGELSPGTQESLQKVMGRGADSLIPSFKMGMPQLPNEMIIPQETIEQMHSYSSQNSKYGRTFKKFFSDIVTIPYELLNAAIGTMPLKNEQTPRAKQAADFLRKRFDRMFGLDEEGDEKNLAEMEKKLRSKEQLKAHPASNTLDVASLNSEQQAKAAETMKEVMDAAKILSTRGRPQIRKDIEDIQTMRLRADAISGGDNPADAAEAASLRFQAYNRVRGIINPFPDKMNLGALQSQGLQRIDNPNANLAVVNRRLVTVMEQLVAQLRAQGIIVPHAYQDTNFR